MGVRIIIQLPFLSCKNMVSRQQFLRLIRIPLYLLALLFDNIDKIIKRQYPMQYLVLFTVAEYSSLLRLEMNATPFASAASNMLELVHEKVYI